VGGSLLLLIGVSGIALLQARRRPYWPVGWFWYLGTLVPVIGLVQVGAQAIADRYAYLPMIGLFILIVWAVSDTSRRWPQRRILLAVLSALIVAGMSLSTVRQLSFWQNSETLFRRALSVTENNHIAHSNLGAAMMRAGRSEEAMAHYAAALRIRPLPEYHNNLGKMLAEQGRSEEAMAHYREALRENPAYAEALNNIGTVLGGQGKLEEALIHFNRAAALKPDYADAHNNLGFALALQGKYGAAVPHYETALRFNQDHPGIYHNLGVSLMALGRREEAAERFREALRLRPGDAEILQRLREASTWAQEGRRPPGTGNR
jgi:tetratricopeptide (TPR) repeat protein